MSAALVLAGRSLRLGLRNPGVLVQTFVFPALLLGVFLVAFSDVVPTPDGIEYAQRLVPLLVLVGASFGGMVMAGGVVREREEGMVDRMRSLPLGDASVLGGRVLGETARVVLSGVLLVAIGSLVGFRFSAGVAGALGFALLVTAVGATYAVVFLTLGLRARSVESLLLINPLMLVLMFLSPGFVPQEAFPDWLGSVVEYNPYTSIIDAALGLTAEGEVTGPLLRSVAWCTGVAVVAGAVGLRRYRSLGD